MLEREAVAKQVSIISILVGFVIKGIVSCVRYRSKSFRSPCPVDIIGSMEQASVQPLVDLYITLCPRLQVKDTRFHPHLQ